MGVNIQDVQTRFKKSTSERLGVQSNFHEMSHNDCLEAVDVVHSACSPLNNKSLAMH